MDSHGGVVSIGALTPNRLGCTPRRLRHFSRFTHFHQLRYGTSPLVAWFFVVTKMIAATAGSSGSDTITKKSRKPGTLAAKHTLALAFQTADTESFVQIQQIARSPFKPVALRSVSA